MGLLAEKVQDNRLLRLIAGALKAGYLEDWKWNPSLSGTPQGGILSPTLANIYPDRLDKFVENTLLPAYNLGKRRQFNEAYNTLAHQILIRRRSGHRIEELHQLYKLIRATPSIDPCDPDYRRLRYMRYADDCAPRRRGKEALMGT